MKEDAQLICPVSYDDPDGQWDKLQSHILDRLPLRDVTWKSPISSSFITIDKLPLRFLPSSANLFKDTDHSFRWFLSPYVYIYILIAETLDSYKTQKPNVKKWVDMHNTPKGNLGKCPWLVVYVPLGNYSIDSYNKINAKIASDFYVDRSGDRSVMLILPNDGSSGMSSPNSMLLMNQSQNSFSELSSKMREGIVLSFQHRSSLYDADIRKLDSMRATPNFDFRQLFLVKESLALLYQMMQLSDMALGQYEELEVILSTTSAQVLPDSDWPLIAPEPFKTSESAQDAISPTREKEKDLMTDAVKNGDDIVVYSINLARMKILKNKMSLLELHRYVFARQMFFLITLQRPVQCAQKALQFLTFCAAAIEKRIFLPDGYPGADQIQTYSTSLKVKQAEVWALTASVKVLRVCRDLIKKIFHMENTSGGGNSAASAAAFHFGDSSSHSVASVLAAGSRRLTSETSMHFNHEEGSIMDQSFRASSMLNERFLILKESFLVLSDIMEFACTRFQRLTPVCAYSSSIAHHAVSAFAQDSLQLSAQTAIISFPQDIDPTKTTKAAKVYYNASKYFKAFQDESGVLAIQKLQKELDQINIHADNNLDQMLVSISQRIRTASHYWAKIFGVEKSRVLEWDDAEEDDKYMMLSERANCNRLQTEIGRTLELSLCILMYKSLAELHILSDRWRFSNWCKMQVVDAMISSAQFALSNRMLCDLVFLTNIASQQQSLTNSVGASTTSSTMNTMVIKRDSSLINSSLNTWPELKLWALQSLLLSSAKVGEQETHRKALAWLILAQSYQQESIRDKSQHQPILSQWLSELSKVQPEAALESVSLNPEDLSNKADKPSMAATSITILPANKFLNVQVRVCKSKEEEETMKHAALTKKAGSPLSASARSAGSSGAAIVKGYEMIHDEMFPVSVFQYECDPHGHFAYLQLDSDLDQDLEVENLVLIFKKVFPESFQSSFGAYTGGVHPLSAQQFQHQYHDDEDDISHDNIPPPDMHSMVRSFYEVGEDEFICELCEDCFATNSSGNKVIRISPGENTFRISFHPTSLGEYGLDRIVLHVGSVVFYSKALNSSTSNYFNNIFPDSTVIPVPAMMTAAGISSPMSNPQSPTMVMKELENIPYTQQDIQNYFDTYPLIKIQEPKDLLGVSVDTANITPPYQNDFCYLHIKTFPADMIEEMMICILPREEAAKKISRQIKARHSFTGLTNKSNAVPTSSSSATSSTGQQLTMKTLTRANSGFFEKGSNSPVRKNMFYQGNSLDDAEGMSTKLRSPSMTNELEVKIAEPEDWEMFCVKNSDQEVVPMDVMYDFYHHSSNQSQLASPALPFGQPSSFSAMQGYSTMGSDNSKTMHRCVKFYNIPGDVSIYIRVPFRALPTVNQSYNNDVIYVSGLQAMIEGRLKRGICNIPFQIQGSNQISCGMLLTGNAIAHNPHATLHKDQLNAFLQTQIHNLGPDNVSIVGFNLLHSNPGVEGDEAVAEEEQKDQFCVGQSPSGLTNYQQDSPYTFHTDRTCKMKSAQHDVNASEDYYAAFSLSGEGGRRHSLPHLLIRFFYYRVNDSLLASNQWLSKDHDEQKKEVRLFAFDINIMESLANKVHVANKTSLVINDTFRNVVNRRFCQTNRITTLSQSPKKRFCAVLGQLTKVTGKLSCKHREWKYSIHSAESITLLHRTGEHSATPLLQAHLHTPNSHVQLSTPQSSSWIVIGAQSAVDKVDSEDFEMDVEIFVIPIEAGDNLLPPLKVEVQQNKEITHHLLHPDHDDGSIEITIAYSVLDAEALLAESNEFAVQKVTTKFVCVREDVAFDVFDNLDASSSRYQGDIFPADSIQ